MKAADKANDVAIPEGLTHMNKFLEFELRLRNHLKSRIGSSGTSLLYVIRLKEDGDVGDEQRIGTVGQGPTDAYGDWVDYTIRCSVNSRDYFLSDDASWWTRWFVASLLSEWVRGSIPPPASLNCMYTASKRCQAKHGQVFVKTQINT